MAQIRQTARRTHLSQQDVIRQSTILGMPHLVRQLAESGIDSLTPLSDKELAASYAKMSAEEIAEDAELGRASIKAQKGK
jgi:hypothetical protein